MEPVTYPLSPEERAKWEQRAVLAEPYDTEEDEIILDGDIKRVLSTRAKFVVLQDDKIREELAGKESVNKGVKRTF